MSTTYTQEENVCVGCKAAVETQIGFPNGMRLWCCVECADDGSLMKWLVRELEIAIAAAGGTYRIENGKKLWTLPEVE